MIYTLYDGSVLLTQMVLSHLRMQTGHVAWCSSKSSNVKPFLMILKHFQSGKAALRQVVMSGFLSKNSSGSVFHANARCYRQQAKLIRKTPIYLSFPPPIIPCKCHTAGLFKSWKLENSQMNERRHHRSEIKKNKKKTTHIFHFCFIFRCFSPDPTEAQRESVPRSPWICIPLIRLLVISG